VDCPDDGRVRPRRAHGTTVEEDLMPRLTPIAIGVLAGLAVGALLAAPQLSAQGAPVAQPPADQPRISVVGEGVVPAAPDVARVTLGVEVTDASLATAQAEAAQRMSTVIAALKAAGIPDSDIQTVSYRISPQYEQSGALRGHEVENLVAAKITNLTGLGPLIDQVVAAGATRVASLQFEASNPATLQERARQLAVQQARAQADQLAAAAGVSVGRPILIEEMDTGGPQPFPAGQRVAAAPAAATPIQPGEIEVRTMVRVTWALQ
jgi:uncharacterized protein YggE